MTEKRKTHTSTAVKARYNAKTYSRFVCDLRNEDFERIEALRGEMSRAAFLKMLVEEHERNTGKFTKSE